MLYLENDFVAIKGYMGKIEEKGKSTSLVETVSLLSERQVDDLLDVFEDWDGLSLWTREQRDACNLRGKIVIEVLMLWGKSVSLDQVWEVLELIEQKFGQKQPRPDDLTEDVHLHVITWERLMEAGLVKRNGSKWMVVSKTDEV